MPLTSQCMSLIFVLLAILSHFSRLKLSPWEVRGRSRSCPICTLLPNCVWKICWALDVGGIVNHGRLHSYSWAKYWVYPIHSVAWARDLWVIFSLSIHLIPTAFEAPRLVQKCVHALPFTTVGFDQTFISNRSFSWVSCLHIMPANQPSKPHCTQVWSLHHGLSKSTMFCPSPTLLYMQYLPPSLPSLLCEANLSSVLHVHLK